jgi:hypothetical protein
MTERQQQLAILSVEVAFFYATERMRDAARWAYLTGRYEKPTATGSFHDDDTGAWRDAWDARRLVCAFVGERNSGDFITERFCS